ncbi:MAG: DNA-binding protein [Eubacteriales bacterium]|nr:DNA-binding protein [Eubacteriales bacterium]
MEFRRFGNKYVLRLDKGEEVVASLKNICEEQKITLGWIKGIGAVNKVRIGLFKTDVKEYSSKELTGYFEITSLLGNVSTMNGEVYLHLHVNVGDDEYKTYGGHLNYAVVSATAEIEIEAIDSVVERKFSDEVGLNLYEFK